MEIIMKQTGEVRVAESLEKAGYRATHLYPVLRLIAKDMMRVEGELFVSQGRRGGGSWKRLRPSTVRQKGNTTILYDTGDLFRSLTRFRAQFQVLNFDTQNGVELGTDRPWAYVHQYGDDRTPQHVPKREFLRVRDRDVEKWSAWLMEYLMAAFEENETPLPEEL